MISRARPLSEILNKLSELSIHHPAIRWYGFGSFFRSRCSFNDIDLLAISPTDWDTNSIRSSLHDLLMIWPIHLTIMTEAEEAETNFVTNQECQLLTPSETSHVRPSHIDQQVA